MYSNIDPAEGISTLYKDLNEFKSELSATEEEQIDLICELTKLVMTTNVFQFGSSWWIQLIRTAMGTPCACIYATIFFAYFERTRIMHKYQNNLLFYRRQIDNIFGIWIPDKNNPIAWTDFQTDLNEYCKLKWETNPLSHQVDFLDLTIWIDEDTRCLQYKTYQKEMNLFLYIPKHSAPPPSRCY